MKKLSFVTVILFALFSGACAYKPSMQQGNILDQKEVNQIKPGMTKDQITYILGKPVLDTELESNVWYYVYYSISSRGVRKEQRLILTFDGDTLKSTEGTLKPEIVE